MATHERPENRPPRVDKSEPEITSPDPATQSRDRRSLVTTSHEVIRQ